MSRGGASLGAESLGLTPAQRQTLWTCLGASTVSLIAALIYYRQWLLHLGVPFELTDDAVQKLELATATVRDGWFLRMPEIGLPGVGQHLDFPRYDSLNYFAIKLLAAFGSGAVVATNVYFLLGYPLVALTAGFVLRALEVDALWSFVGAIAYAWLPYHQLRGFHHFTNAAYFFVPFVFLFLRRIWYAPDSTRRWSARSWLMWLLFGALLELQNPYYAVFTGVLLVTTGVALGLLRGLRTSALPLGRTAILITVIIATFAFEQLPRWAFEHEHGKNVLAVVRPPRGVSEFALSLVDLVNPSPDHPLHFLAKWTQAAADIRGYKHNERVVATLPFIGLFGLAVAEIRLVIRAWGLHAGDQRQRLQQWAGGLILLSLLWCHEGGLATLISETGFGLVRGWNRMSIFIAFACVLAAVSWFDGRALFWKRGTRIAAAVLVTTLVLAEQLFALPRSTFAATAERWNEARKITGDIAADGRLHRLFVVPYLDYPEVGKIGDVQDYDHFVLNIASDKAALSYGSMRGRGASYFSSGANGLHGADLVSYLKQASFDTIVIDTFAPDTTPLQLELAHALGTPVARTRRYLAYRIASPAPHDPPEAAWRGYDLGTVLNFKDIAARRYLELNFSTFEADGTWTIGPLAAVRLSTPPLPKTLVLELQGNIYEDPQKPQRIQLFFDGEPICSLTPASASLSITERFRCRFTQTASDMNAGTHELRFQIEHPVSPQMLKAGPDPRLLGLRIVSLELTSGDDGS
jgi:phosphoglycerol transferase